MTILDWKIDKITNTYQNNVEHLKRMTEKRPRSYSPRPQNASYKSFSRGVWLRAVGLLDFLV